MKSAQAVGGYRLILGYMGVIFILIGITVLLPLIMLIPYPQEAAYGAYFVIPGAAFLLLGYLLSFLVRGCERQSLDKNQSAFIVTAAWLSAIAAASIPFLMTGQYTFTQSVFEATSGWSTTGLTMVEVSSCPRIFLFHRSLMLFFGGVGLVLIMLSVLTDAYGMRLYHAEGHSDKLLPNLVHSSQLIMLFYTSYIFLGTILYMLCGLGWFDALNHAIAAVATGGFSTRPENIGYYNSVSVEVVSMLLMLLGTTNFVAMLYLLRGKVRNFFRYCEVRFTLFLLALFIPLTAWLVFRQFGFSPAESLRISAFQVISAFTTTGFQTVPTFHNWFGVLFIPLILLMLSGGQSGSTSGGIKQYRVYIVLKSILWDIRDTFSNEHMVRTNYVKKPDANEIITVKHQANISTFCFLYLGIFLLGSAVIASFGYSFEEAMFEFSSAMGGVGLSCGITAPDADPAILWTLSFGMFIGRLEIYVVIMAFLHLLHLERRIH